MTLQQLRYLREVARRSLNISSAAAALYTSQPGISRQIQLLERELGIELLQRRKNRIVGLTDAGRKVVDCAQRTLNEAERIKAVAAECKDATRGKLLLATSHLHARHTLAQPITAFAARYPDVELHLLQSAPDEVATLVERGEADIGVGTDLRGRDGVLAVIACAEIRRSVIVPRDHPLARRRRVSLQDVASYPMITYSTRLRAGQILAGALAAANLEPRVVVSASDSDVIKAYVAQGLGIAVVPSIALDAADTRFAVIEATALFPRSMATVCLRTEPYPRGYIVDFLQTLMPQAERAAIEAAIRTGASMAPKRPPPRRAQAERPPATGLNPGRVPRRAER
jgi:LysR family cys regulon transcriptional activator